MSSAAVLGHRAVFTHPRERALALQIARVYDALESVVEELEPALLAEYAHELAQAFARFYKDCPVLQAYSAATLTAEQQHT